MRNQILAFILAGGKGARLDPLTRDRAKPAVPFGGSYRIVDFALSNCYNSGIRQIMLLTQYKSRSLDRHLLMGWSRYFCREMGEYLDVAPPEQRIDESWYTGTADAVYQNLYAIDDEKPEYVLILAGDHIYKMNYRKMIGFHISQRADVTVGTLTCPIETAASQFGVMEVDNHHHIVGFEEKPTNPKPLPDQPGHCFVSMGIYVFSAKFLTEKLRQDAACKDSKHDFGANIIPSLIQENRRVVAFNFLDENRKKEAYWRDVGTLDAYYEANMDLVNVDPLLNVYDDEWPIFTYHPNYPPPKFVFAESDRIGHATDSVVCSGTIVSGGTINQSILGHAVRVNSFAAVNESIIFDDVTIGRHAKIRRSIIDKGVHIPPGVSVGYDHELDLQRGFTITENGITVIAKAAGTSAFD